MTSSTFGSSRVSRRTFLAGGLGSLMAATLSGYPSPASAAAIRRPGSEALTAEVAHSWMATIYDVVWPEGLTPPNAARVYAYCAIAMYEAVAPPLDLWSMGGRLNGLGDC
jgi:hypothetical protein